MQKSLHPSSTTFIIAHNLLDFVVQQKETEAEAPIIRLDSTSSRLSVPPPPSSPPIFMTNALSATTFQIYPGLGQAPNNAGLHIRRLALLVCIKQKTLRQNMHLGGVNASKFANKNQQCHSSS